MDDIKDFVTIRDIIENLSWGSIPLWLSISIPIYWAFIKKISHPHTTDSESQSSLSITGSLKSIFVIPKLKNRGSTICISFFILGTFTTLIDRYLSEKVRNNALRIKNYMIEKNYYSISKSSLLLDLGLHSNEIDRVIKQFPSEFVQSGWFCKDSSQTIVLTDSLLVIRIITRSEKILDQYLSNPTFEPNKCLSMDDLFVTNNFFTYRTCYKLLEDFPEKYYLSKCNDISPGIVKR